jgi:hypothetical protein
MALDVNSIVLAVTLVTLVLVLVLMIKFKLVEKYFMPLKFRMMNTYVHDPSQKKDFLKLAMYNTTLNDARVTSFGYVYRQKNIDYFREYLVQQGFQPNHQALVAARDSLSFSLPLNALVDVIQDINNGKFRARKIVAYATTSFGQTTYVTTPLVRKHIQKTLEKRAKVERTRLAGIRRQQRLLRRQKTAQQLARTYHTFQFWFKKTFVKGKQRTKNKHP